jgi:hypothetical protein
MESRAKHFKRGMELRAKHFKSRNIQTISSLGFQTKEISSRKGFFKKGANQREMLMGSPKEHVSIAMKWDITPKIAPNPNQGMGVIR